MVERPVDGRAAYWAHQVAGQFPDGQRAGPLRGYGFATAGPVGTTAPNPYLSATGKQGDPYPYNPTKAKTLLSSHGWKVVPN